MDRFSYDGAEPPTVAECAQCRGDIRRGDEVTVLDGGDIVHDRCERAYFNDKYVFGRGVVGGDVDIY